MPNSCYSVMFVDPRFFNIKKKNTIKMNMPSMNESIVLEGQWLPLNLTVQTNYNGTPE